jgi:hypothetical protein
MTDASQTKPEQSYRCPRVISVCQCGAEYCRGDHRPDNTGLDDGPLLRTPRKKAAPKPAAVAAEIRSRAWATRRAKYGEHGHR